MENLSLTWIKNNFICHELYTPFVLEKDAEYCESLRSKYEVVLKQAKVAGADEESLHVIKTYSNNILKALKCYYSADITKTYAIVKKLIKDISDEPLAINELLNSWAFPGVKGRELQLFRSRLGSPSESYLARDMLHLPENKRSHSGNYRFSIPGNPSFYLSNSSYGCWIEMGFPDDAVFNVSPVLVDGKQKILNLAVSIRDFSGLNEFEDRKVHCWLKLLLLSIATSYNIKEDGRIFKSEYVISQAIMIACKKMKLDGVAYYSKRVTDELFSFCAINLALFVNYDENYSEITRHIKLDDSYNFSIYKKLKPSLTYKDYELRSVQTGLITNIGRYDRQYPFAETDFYDFDKFLFTTWRDKPNGKGKDQIPWGAEFL